MVGRQQRPAIRISGGAVYELPFGSGKRWRKEGGVLAALVGGWQTGGTFEYQPGSLITFGNNLFYYGDLNDITKDKPEIALKADGTLDASKYWFNVANFETNPSRTPTSFQIDGLRGPDLMYVNMTSCGTSRSAAAARSRRGSMSEPPEPCGLQQPDHRSHQHELRQGHDRGRVRGRDALLQLRDAGDVLR